MVEGDESEGRRTSEGPSGLSSWWGDRFNKVTGWIKDRSVFWKEHGLHVRGEQTQAAHERKVALETEMRVLNLMVEELKGIEDGWDAAKDSSKNVKDDEIMPRYSKLNMYNYRNDQDKKNVTRAEKLAIENGTGYRAENVYYFGRKFTVPLPRYMFIRYPYGHVQKTSYFGYLALKKRMGEPASELNSKTSEQIKNIIIERWRQDLKKRLTASERRDANINKVLNAETQAYEEELDRLRENNELDKDALLAVAKGPAMYEHIIHSMTKEFKKLPGYRGLTPEQKKDADDMIENAQTGMTSKLLDTVTTNIIKMEKEYYKKVIEPVYTEDEYWPLITKFPEEKHATSQNMLTTRYSHTFQAIKNGDLDQDGNYIITDPLLRYLLIIKLDPNSKGWQSGLTPAGKYKEVEFQKIDLRKSKIKIDVQGYDLILKDNQGNELARLMFELPNARHLVKPPNDNPVSTSPKPSTDAKFHEYALNDFDRNDDIIKGRVRKWRIDWKALENVSEFEDVPQNPFRCYRHEYGPGLDKNGKPLEISENGEVLIDKWAREEDAKILNTPSKDQRKANPHLKYNYSVTDEIAEYKKVLDEAKKMPELTLDQQKKKVALIKFLEDPDDPNNKGKIPELVKFAEELELKGKFYPRSVPKEFYELIDGLEMANYVNSEWDSFRDDFRDARYHQNSLTVIDYVMADYKDPHENLWESKTEEELHNSNVHRVKRFFKKKYVAIEEDVNGNKREVPSYTDYQYQIGERIPTNLLPAFFRPMVSKMEGTNTFTHLGRKFYYDTPADLFDRSSKYMKEQIVTTRGLSMYVINKFFRYERNVETSLKELRKALNNIDFGPRAFAKKDLWTKDPYKAAEFFVKNIDNVDYYQSLDKKEEQKKYMDKIAGITGVDEMF